MSGYPGFLFRFLGKDPGYHLQILLQDRSRESR
uniref:Uncharacterized protein n=1 Tax=Myoviridae sp. ctcyQ27 TaxID=2825139 RepID=A0A8S5UF66_9CAUD|nr:MAG TPA: hypothetical protein [Myoviridae sp. ctcyQ27]